METITYKTIWWPALCGNATEDDALWSDNVTVYTFRPDLTQCFQNTVLVWTPCFCLWLSALFWVPLLVTRRTRLHSSLVSRLNLIKVCLGIMLSVISVVDLIKAISDAVTTTGTPAALIVKYSFILFSMVLATCITRLEFCKGVISSGVLFCYWMLFAIVYIVPFRSNILHISYMPDGSVVISDYFHFVTFYIAYGLILVEFVLSLFADTTVKALEQQSVGSMRVSNTEQQILSSDSAEANEILLNGGVGDPDSKRKTSSTADISIKAKKECPEETASFLNKLTFSWITGLIFTGYRRQLVFDDIWELRHSDQCETLIPNFETQWGKELEKHNQFLRKQPKVVPVVMHTSDGENGSAEIVDDETQSEKPNARLKGDVSGAKSAPSPGRSPASSWRASWRVFGPVYMVAGIYKLIYDLITFLNPLILNKLISFVNAAHTQPGSYVWHGYFYVAALFVVSMVRSVLLQQYWHLCFLTGQRMRSVFIGVVYRKALRLSSAARRTTTVGEIVNLMSVDAQKFQDTPAYMHMIWSTPLTIALALYMLYQFMGPSVFAGLAAMLLLVPINGFVANKTKVLQVLQMKFKDSRIKLMTEILNGIKVLKLYSWEESFKANILNIREKELQVLKTSQYLSAASAVSWFMAPYLVLALEREGKSLMIVGCRKVAVALGTFAVYVLSSPDNVLNANNAFVSLSLFNILNYPLSILPIVISFGVQASVSMKRIVRFLLEDEIDVSVIDRSPDTDAAIKVENASTAWGKTDMPALVNASLTIPEGALVAVVGQVGSGKSSLISALCGEMEVQKGKISVKGSVAYVPQQAWIQNTTIRENILFARSYRQRKYDTVIEACALLPDLRILPGEDQTEVGEKGINLSGGQKQRISLARAVYQNADVYLLDDPLSAVDSHVGKHIFEQVIGPTGLLKKKTRILVTNSVTYLSQMDLIVVLRNGQISEMGAFNDLLSHKGPFAEFVTNYLLPESDTSDPEVAALTRQISTVSGVSDEHEAEKRRTVSGSGSETSPSISKSGQSKPRLDRQLSEVSEKQQQQKKEKGNFVKGQRLIEEEAAMTGRVKLAVFWSYLQACRFMPVVALVIWYTIYLASQIGTNIWLSVWSNDPPPFNSSMQDTHLRDLRLGVYGGFGLLQAVGVFGMSFSMAVACVSSSRILHLDLLSAVFRAPMAFFDTTPLGRIINRLSRDVDTVDVNLPMTIRIWLGTFSGVFTTICVIAYATPIFLVIVVPLGIGYYFVQRFYISTSRQLRRIDSVIRSPIYVHFGETVSGVSSIRAYRQEDRFVAKSDLLTDRNQMVTYAIIVSNRWLGLWLEAIGNLIVLFAGLFAVIQRDQINGGLAGLSVSYALQVTGALNMWVRMTSDLETYIVSVERIYEYVDCPKEAAAIVPDNRPSLQWPDSGVVQFRNYSVRYRENLDLVLSNITCDIKAGEKVGIVGRTGAGKSSLTLSLFRIIEAAAGNITIDGVDIGKIGLRDLRSRLTIIPQDPVVFSGTLRMNLDPADERTDNEVWSALQQAHLESFVRGLPEELGYICSEGGENLSVGQRQLVCLARALLRKTKILILDEATASVDLETDDMIQQTIRTTFNDCTVITIAHRLNTIMDYDRVLVLDRSRIVEFDPPSVLLKKPDSIFYSLAKTAGIAQ